MSSYQCLVDKVGVIIVRLISGSELLTDLLPAFYLFQPFRMQIGKHLQSRAGIFPTLGIMCLGTV